MDIGIVSMRYAKALMEYAKEVKMEDVLYQEVKSLETKFRTYPDLRRALDNPILTIREKSSLIHAATSGSTAVSKEFERFIALILRNRREGFLQYICLSFMELYRRYRHIGVAKLITAVPINEEISKRIQQSASTMLHARIELQTVVEPSIKGGFVFDINDYRLDASIATQLRIVKEQFIDKNKRIV